MRKLELMHSLFGIDSEHKCKECSNLTSREYTFKKCKVYGRSDSEATDWCLKYEACGMFNKEYSETPIKDLKKHYPREVDNTPMEGQIDLFDANG